MAGSMRGGSARRTPDGHAGVRKHQGHCYLNNNKSASAGHTWRGGSRWLRFLIVWISLMSCTCSASSTSPTEPPGRQEKVCKDIDIRNRVNFSKLENCTVIEGSLQILLIDYADPSEYENLHFPKLLEITDYLLLYRVYGLKTLAHIFPNLAVIRGQKLFFNYALVAFEMPDIEELGLAGLTHIVRGAVRLEKNAKLCYVHTIDWSRIARNVSREDHFISQNKDQNECVDVCPRKGLEGGDRCERLYIPNEDGINRTRAVCWTANHCQKVCRPKCESGCFHSPVSQKTECCNEHCIGGCWGPAATQCFACKDVLGISGRCQQRCTGTFKYMNRRCILRRDCENLKTRGAMYSQVQWKLHQNECIKDCPSGYMDMEGNNRCKKCPGPCPKVCMAKVVDSVATAQELKGCTVIEGILEIQIRGGNRVMQELEESLGLIQKIPALKIVGSMAIDSLRFLRSLQVIDGETLFSDRYSLFVLDNQNLQEIWDLKTHPKLTLLQGSLFFHRNHKLCYYKIQDFVHSLELDLGSQDISAVTNGDQMPCNISQIQIQVTQVKVTFAVVKWTAFEMNDNRQLLSYVIYYKESPYKNQTIFNAKDSCGLEDWQTFDVRPVPGHNLAELVYDLKPWTQYAMYIQTYTLSSTSEGGVSPIIYFTTLPTTPTHPRDVQVKAISPNELRVTWLPPNKPNGNVTHYQVYWQPQPLNREKLDRRNYCTDKLHLGWKTRKSEVEMKKEEERNHTLPSQCCKCPKTEEEKKQEEEERRMEIEFQNFLQDTVYVKRPPKNGKPETESDGSQMQVGRRRRRRRGISDSKVQTLMQNLQNLGLNESYWLEGLNISSLSNMSMVNETEGPDEEHVPYVAAVVYGKTEMILPNLKHFQEYSIEVIACHDPQVNDKTEKQCSNRAITTGRTQDESFADTINPQNVSAQVEPDGRVSIRWADPPEPNGLIVTYEIEYGKVSQENYKLDVLCIPHLEYRKSNGYTMGSSKRLQPGNYSYRIRATSLAGNGTWTPKFYFLLHDRYDEKSFRNTLVIVIPVVVVVVFLVIFLGGMMYFVYKKRMAGNLPAGVLYASVNPHYMSPDDVYIPDKWEVPRDKIKLLRELGQGSFGMVHEGIATDLIKDVITTKVAVKTVNENATIRDRIEFLQEASVMKAFNCDHVVKLLGVVSKGQPTMVIMELMASGDLKNFLRMHRPTEDDNDGRKPPTLKQILQMSGEIADGMAYLSAMKFVHRDLAARNCMVSEDIIVKVGDFGMTRDIYETDYYRKGGKGLLPVRWMAPESLKDGIFTSQSDVWSFGVVLWEMATLAFQPYQGLANEQVLKYVIDGGVMQQPYGCPERLYNMMLLCWRHNAKQRPTFINIVESLAADLNEDFRKKSYFYSEERKDKEREQEEKERENAEKERENAEIEQAEAKAMAAAKANAIGPEEFEPFNDEEDITTPLTGSPRYSSQELDDLEADHRHSLESLCSQCSHRRPCECIDIDNAKSKPGPSSGSPLRRLYMGTVPHDVPTNSGDHRVGVGPPPVTSSSEGSKESTKSSGSSHLHLNGISNGHLPRAYLAQHKYAEC